MLFFIVLGPGESSKGINNRKQLIRCVQMHAATALCLEKFRERAYVKFNMLVFNDIVCLHAI